MLTDREKHSSCKSLRSSSLVSSLFESATSIIHPLERLEPTNVDNVDIQIDSTKATPEHPSTSESIQLTHFGRTGLSAYHTATNSRLDERKGSEIVVAGGLVAQAKQQQHQQQQSQSPERWECFEPILTQAKNKQPRTILLLPPANETKKV